MNPDPILGTINLAGHTFPGIWQYLLPEDALHMNLPAEARATCHSCFKAAIGECRADCQCCTYFPQIPNFMLGLALRGAEGKHTVARLVREGFTLPQGLLVSPQRFLGAVQMQSEDRFGEVPEQLCPFIQADTMHCGVYAFRNSVCSTYFCHHDHGDEGADFWGRVQLLVGHIETALQLWAMDEVGLPAAEYIARLDALAPEVHRLSTPTGAWQSHALDHLWANWRGRELEFFHACAERVMTRRARLYEIACAQPFLEARKFEQALRDWLPEPLREEVPPVSEGENTAIEDLWYLLQRAERGLWALPFNTGRVMLREDLAIEPNRREDTLALVWGQPWVVRGDDPSARMFITEPEARLLSLFKEPQMLGEAFFQRTEVQALPHVRSFLAHCMRRFVLVHRP